MFIFHLYIFSFAKQFGHPYLQGYGSFIHQWTKRYGIMNKAICFSEELAAPIDELEEWIESVLIPTLTGHSPNISTTVTKQPCSTSLFLTELTALVLTSLLVLPNIKTN